MEFRETLWKARGYDRKAMMEIIEMYRPLMIKYAVVNGRFDEDLYQECGLIVTYLDNYKHFVMIRGEK